MAVFMPMVLMIVAMMMLFVVAMTLRFVMLVMPMFAVLFVFALFVRILPVVFVHCHVLSLAIGASRAPSIAPATDKDILLTDAEDANTFDHHVNKVTTYN